MSVGVCVCVCERERKRERERERERERLFRIIFPYTPSPPAFILFSKFHNHTYPAHIQEKFSKKFFQKKFKKYKIFKKKKILKIFFFKIFFFSLSLSLRFSHEEIDLLYDRFQAAVQFNSQSLIDQQKFVALVRSVLPWEWR